MKLSGLIDLHTHSTASDGSLSPQELVKRAVESGLSVLALTDHDTVSGNEAAAAEAKKRGIEFLPGIEISCDFVNKAIHILGYWIDCDDEPLNHTLTRVIEYRSRRNDRLVARFRELGIKLDYDEIKALAGNEVIGRPHFALVLIRQGVVKDIREAFEKYLGEGGKAYLPKVRLSAQEGINLILGAGGIPCLAHPKLYQFKNESHLREAMNDLIVMGLGGIEAYYPVHTPQDVQLYLKLAAEYRLAVSGGSDYHGAEITPDIKLGRGMGNNLNIGYGVYLELKQYYAELQLVNPH